MRHLIKYLAATALLLTAALPIQAQEDNAAFYIYQNDGHFDGFFYDQVQKISFSKLDTLGVEHTDFVSQEIITADSTYRIMLTAIDSVGFVQPEIRYSPKLKVMEDVGILKYVMGIGTDGALLLAHYMPKDLVPQVGDVLVCYDFKNTFFPEGFGGKVTKVLSYSGHMHYVYTDPLTDFSDIFENFITVEDYGYDEDTQQMQVRRVAGIDNPRRASGDYQGVLFKLATSPHLQWVKGDVTASIDLKAAIECRAKAVWNFSVWGEKYFKLDLKEKVDLGMSATLDYKQKTPWKAETNFSKLAPIYLPAAAPILRVLLTPEGFIRSELHATAQAATKTLTLRAGQSIEFKDWAFHPSMTFGKEAKFDDEEDGDNSPLIQLSGSLSGFVQVGAKWPFIIRTNEFFKKVLDAEVGMNVYAGPKVSGEVNINLNDLGSSIIDGNPTKLYNTVKDSKLTLNPFSIDYEFKSAVSWLGHTGDTLTILDGTLDWTSWDYYLFPIFDEPQVMPARPYGDRGNVIGDPSAQTTTNPRLWVNVKPRRNVFLGAKIGAAIVNNKDSVVCIDYDRYGPIYYEEKSFDQDKKRWDDLEDSDVSDLQAKSPIDGMGNIDLWGGILPGNYKVYPAIKVLDKDIICEPSVDYTIPGAYFDIFDGYRDIKLPGDKVSETEIVLKTNGHIFKRGLNYASDFWVPTGNEYTRNFPNQKGYNHDICYKNYRDPAYNLPDTLLVKVGRNPDMLPLNTNIELAVIAYNSAGRRDTLENIVTVTQPATNIYDRMILYFEADMIENGFNIPWHVHKVMSFDTSPYTSRSGDIINCSFNGKYGNDDCKVKYICNVPNAEIQSGSFTIEWKDGGSSYTLKFDCDGIVSDTGQAERRECRYVGRPKNCTLRADYGNGDIRTYSLQAGSGTCSLTLNPRDINVMANE